MRKARYIKRREHTGRRSHNRERYKCTGENRLQMLHGNNRKKWGLDSYKANPRAQSPDESRGKIFQGTQIYDRTRKEIDKDTQ